MNPKIKLWLVKLGLSAIFAAAMGYTYKAQLMIEDKLDADYEAKKKQDASSEDPA